MVKWFNNLSVLLTLW